MKSPLFVASAISAVCSIIVFFIVSQSTSISAPYVAVMVFISAVVTHYITGILTTSNQSTTATNTHQVKTVTDTPARVDTTSDSNIETLYVGNLPYKANETAVKEYLNNFVDVQSVRLMKDRKTGKRKGYGFVEVLTNDLEAAIAGLNDKVFLDRSIKVRPAKDKTEAEA